MYVHVALLPSTMHTNAHAKPVLTTLDEGVDQLYG